MRKANPIIRDSCKFFSQEVLWYSRHHLLFTTSATASTHFFSAFSAALAFSSIALAHSSSVIFSVQTSFFSAAAFSPLHPLVPELAALSAPTVPSVLPPQPLPACRCPGTIAPTAVTRVAMPRLARTFFSSLPSIAFSFVDRAEYGCPSVR